MEEVKPIFVARVYAEDSKHLYNIRATLYEILSEDYHIIVITDNANSFEVLNPKDVNIEDLNKLFEECVKSK